MKNIEFEVKIGLFIIIGVILLIVITFSIGDFFLKPGYNLNVEMNFANGIKKSAPVRLAGIEVGEVKDAYVYKNESGTTRVILKLWLQQEAPVEKDAKVSINTLGLIGEKYVEIEPGTPGAEFAKDGDTLTGFDSLSMDEITRKGYEVVEKLEKAVDSFSEILSQIKKGEGSVGMLLFDDSLYNEVEAMVEDLKAHPWKLLNKPRETKEKVPVDKTKKYNKGVI